MELALTIAFVIIGLALAGWYWWRKRTNAAADAAPVYAPPNQTKPAGWPESPPMALRLEAAAPEEAPVGQPFDVIVALLPPGDTPTLPQALAEAKPATPPNGHGTLDLLLRIDAPGFVCHGPATQVARYSGDNRPPIAVFSLSAERPGDSVIRLIAHQGLTEVGRARLRVRAMTQAPDTTDNLGTRATLSLRPPQAADHLLAHAIAANYTPAEFQTLAESLGADLAELRGTTPFTRALDMVQAISRRGDGPALAERVAAERPDWRAAIRGNPRAERLT